MFRYTDGEFKGSLVGTAGIDYKLKSIQMDRKNVKLHIWDTAG
jgi:Ras-related protein Rab-1A